MARRKSHVDPRATAKCMVAVRMVRAGADLKLDAPIRCEFDKRRGVAYVEATLWDGRSKAEMVFFDERGPYVTSGPFNKYRFVESGTGRKEGDLVLEPSRRGW